MKIKLKESNIQKILFGVLLSRKHKKAIRFYDYDGKFLQSYSISEFLNLSVLPSLPDRTSENLTCDGWNWTFEDIKTQINTVGGVVNVGAIYHTTDNKTHITCKPTETLSQAYIFLTPTVANAVTVDWGDGNTDIWTSTSQATKSHTYTGVTDSSVYDITISCSSGTYKFGSYITGSSGNNKNCVYTDIKLSTKVTSFDNYCFCSCSSLQSVTIPSGVTSLSNKCFEGCSSLQFIAIPNGITSLNTYCFQNCYSLQSVAIPSGVTSFGNYCFNNCYSLQSVTLPNTLTTLNIDLFKYCCSLQSVTLPNTFTILAADCFYNCYSLQTITIPRSVTSLGTYCFYGCSTLQKIYCKPTTPPTLVNANAIPNNSNLVIYVPTGTISAYQSASNWSSFSSKMVEYDY